MMFIHICLDLSMISQNNRNNLNISSSDLSLSLTSLSDKLEVVVIKSPYCEISLPSRVSGTLNTIEKNPCAEHLSTCSSNLN